MAQDPIVMTTLGPRTETAVPPLAGSQFCSSVREGCWDPGGFLTGGAALGTRQGSLLLFLLLTSVAGLVILGDICFGYQKRI